MSAKLNMNSVIVGGDGRIELSDEQLISIEKRNIHATAGGINYGIGCDIQPTNGIECDFFLAKNESNCDNTKNIRCDNDWMCRGTSNRQCENAIDCRVSKNEVDRKFRIRTIAG